MAYTADQQKIINAIKQIAARRKAGPKVTKAALETGRVESNFQNLSGGDADSQGWRQERASLYKDPQNLTASINRFIDEALAKRGQYGSAGALAAAVQRPAAQYRGRYQEHSAEADALLGRGGGAPGGGSSGHNPSAGATKTTTTFDEAGYEKARKLSILGNYLAQRDPNSPILRSGLATPGAAPDMAAFKKTVTSTTPAKGGGSTSGKSGKSGSFAKSHSPLLEAFYDPLGGIKRGVEIGAIGGHSDHVHMAAGPKTVVELGKLAQSMGLTVGENSHFNGGKVETGGHAPNSYHYKDQAIDVSGDPKKMAAFYKRVKKLYGLG